MLDKDTNHDVDELIRRSAQMEVPAEVEARMRRQLTEFRARLDRPAPRRWRVWALAAAAVSIIVAALVLIPGTSPGTRVYAAAAQQLRSSQSLEYTIVLNTTPYVAVDLSFLAPAYRRINCSWGMEVRADGVARKQIVLFHATRTYLAEEGKTVPGITGSDDLVEQLKSLPQTADEQLGERQEGGKTLLGFRTHNTPGVQTLDLWVDAATRQPHHIDITVQEAGKPPHQMHIKDIRAGGAINRALFDLTPPAGYTAFAKSAPVLPAPVLHAQIGQTGELTAVVMPMTGPYSQAPVALQAVQEHLKKLGVAPTGLSLGRFESEQHWAAGYPVPPGTSVEAPFQLLSLPATLTASAVVNGPWGGDSAGRWGAFLKSVVEQGYYPSGPPMEIWSGEDAQPAAQSTEMRVPVTKSN